MRYVHLFFFLSFFLKLFFKKQRTTPTQIDCEDTLEAIGSRFLKDVKEPGQEKSALDDMTVSWAVVRGEDTLLSYGQAQLPIKDTGLFGILDVGFQLILIPRGHMTAAIGLEEVECPPDINPSGCCIIS